MKNCWTVLGLEYGVDKKAIKSAYAKRLKKTRPDENPEGFKALHDAYKAASRIAAAPYYQQEGVEREEVSAAPMWDEDSLSVDHDNLSPAALNEGGSGEKKSPVTKVVVDDIPAAKQTHVALNNEFPADLADVTQEEIQRSRMLPEALEQESISNDIIAQQNTEAEAIVEGLQADWDRLFDKVQALIASPKGGLKVQEWQFIEDVPSMLDLEFKRRAADQMFGIVSEANDISLRAKSLRIQPPVLNYLNKIFDWDGKWQDYEMRFGEGMLNTVYPYLNSAQNAGVDDNSGTRPVYYYLRMMAFLMDVGIVFFIVKILVVSLKPFGYVVGHGTDWYLLGLTVYFLLVVPLLEMSRTEASLGKMVFGLRVITKQGLKLPWYQSLWRSIVSLCCIAGFKIVVWLNIFFIHKYDALLQDIVSRSYVARSNNNLLTYLSRLKAFWQSK